MFNWTAALGSLLCTGAAIAIVGVITLFAHIAIWVEDRFGIPYYLQLCVCIAGVLFLITGFVG